MLATVAVYGNNETSATEAYLALAGAVFRN